MSERPMYLTGQLAPVPDEIDAADLEVIGSLPPDLTGRYFRNGPNPLPGQDAGHWFVGHGMIHGVRLVDGRAEWYRNRWVKTRALAGVPLLSDDGALDLAASPANTHVIRHADRILALCEAGLPYTLTAGLGTIGPCDFAGRLTTAMTAHPKQDPLTGDLHFFGYGVMPPFLTYHRLSAAGDLVDSLPVAVPGPTMMHDFAITERHVVWMDLPVVFDLALLEQGMPFRWDDTYGARLGVMRRHDVSDEPGDDAAAEVTWFDVDPCYVFHVGNAREDDSGRVVLDAVRYTSESFTGIWSRIRGSRNPDAAAARASAAQLYRWTLDPASGTRTEEPLDDRPVEFPTLNESRVGRAGRYLYTVGDDGILKYDLQTSTAREHRLEAGTAAGEAVFVPAGRGHAEDDGWLLSIVGDRAGTHSELLVLDAGDLAVQASVRLPRRVPTGFHGSWIPDPA